LVVVGGLMAWEFRRLILPDATNRDIGLWVMVAGTSGAVVATNLFGFFWAFPIVALAAFILWQIKHKRPLWMATGLVYLATPLAALLVIRENQGFDAVMWLVLVVMASDIGGYFFGRIFGGPKFWPAISPKKTWSGTAGGWALAMAVGLGFWLYGAGYEYWASDAAPQVPASPSLMATLFFSVLLAMAAQAGDLFESWLKRKAGMKDSSNLIPGHGGLLDRFDGLLAATTLYMLLHLIGAL
jgi:phosphatidate cytidylyltransferase